MPASARDIRVHDQPAIAVDLVLLTIIDREMKLLVQHRKDDRKVGGNWALPGGIVRIDETLEDCAARVLHDKAGLKDVFFEQLQTFSAVNRDPRGRVISVVYYALTPSERFFDALKAKHDLKPATVQYLESESEGGSVHLRDDKDHLYKMAFDHAHIVAKTVQRLRGKLDYSAVGLELLPHRFTLRDLQEIHEAILDTALTKPVFRKKMIARGWVRPTGKREKGKTFRPAELYERSDLDIVK